MDDQRAPIEHESPRHSTRSANLTLAKHYDDEKSPAGHDSLGQTQQGPSSVDIQEVYCNAVIQRDHCDSHSSGNEYHSSTEAASSCIQMTVDAVVDEAYEDANANSSSVMPTARHKKQRGRPRRLPRKQANLHMSAIPCDYPLLDHDYCYENYCSIVSAAKEMISKLKLDRRERLQRQHHRAGGSIATGVTKRKYRTKRIIAQEKEAEHKALLKYKADHGDEVAKQELEALQVREQGVQLTISAARTKKKDRKASVTSMNPRVVGEGEDDELNELSNEIENATDPVKIHNTTFRDQYLYYGTKVRRSQRRSRVSEDPYGEFWSTGRLPNHQQYLQDLHQRAAVNDANDPLVEQAKQDDDDDTVVSDVLPRNECPTSEDRISSPHESHEKDVKDASMVVYDFNAGDQHSTDQEMTDVLDVLGIQVCSQVQESADAEQKTPARPSLLTEVTDASLIQHEDSSSKLSADGPEELVNTGADSNSDNLRLQAADNSVDRIDELLSSMTSEQISEVIEAIELGSPAVASVGSRDHVETATSRSNVAKDDKGERRLFNPLSLSVLAKAMCASSRDHGHLGSNGSATESNTSSIDDYTGDAPPLLDMEYKHVTLDMLNDLSILQSQTGTAAVVSVDAATGTMDTISQSQQDVDSTTSRTDYCSDSSPVVVPVTMFWNTFPALLIDGIKFVRLIDISRQALPSKETGLLKKRALSLGHSVLSCTDMQRNLLIRYAFACPSRSNLIISAEGAAQVIASYMDKSEIEELSKSFPTGQMTSTDTPKAVTFAPQMTSAEHMALMPQVLIEHKPLQQSRCSMDKRSSTEQDTAMAPERSSRRLRQVKSSYRRFLPPLSSSYKYSLHVHQGIEKEPGHTDYSKSPNTLTAGCSDPIKCDDRKQANKHLEHGGGRGAPIEILGSPADSSSSDKEDTVSSRPYSPAAGKHSQKLDEAITVSDDVSFHDTTATVIHVRHIDQVPKQNGVRLYQDGSIETTLFKSLHSPCVKCSTCAEYMTLKGFSKHQHFNGKLVPVKCRQKLEAKSVSDDNLGTWRSFKKHKQYLETIRSPLTKLVDAEAEPVDCQTSTSIFNAMNAAASTSPDNAVTRLPRRGRKQPKVSSDFVWDVAYRKRNWHMESKSDNFKKRHIA